LAWSPLGGSQPSCRSQRWWARRARLGGAAPGASSFDLALRRKLSDQPNAARPRKLPAAVVNSVSLRPGMSFGRLSKSRKYGRGARLARGGDGSEQDVENAAVKFSEQRAAGGYANATCFASSAHALTPHYVSVAFERKPDDYYKFYFAQLMLCFTCVDLGGERRELCLVRYLWPHKDQMRANEPDGIPLKTRYVFPSSASAKAYAVVDADALEYLAPLVAPPSLYHADDWFLIINGDVYGNFG
jgi:hypothetical protein